MDLIALLSTLALAFLFMLCGRLVTTHADNTFTFSTPFHCLLAGMGVWYLWFLLFSVSMGVSFKITWLLYVVSCLGLLLGMTKAWQGLNEIEHFWTKAISALLLLSPALYWATLDLPMQWEEFAFSMKNAAHLFDLGAMPAADDIGQRGIRNLDAPIASMAAVLPTFVSTAEFIPANFALFNVVLLALVAGGLVHAINLPLRWSNLPWLTGGALLGVSVLNPFLNTDTLLSASNSFPFAIALFATAFPLLRDKKLPRGWAVLPTAFIMAFMAGIHDVAINFVWFIVAWWVVRSFMEDAHVTLPDIFGWAFLLAIPLISWLLWQNYTISAQIISQPLGEGIAWSLLPEAVSNIASVTWENPLAALLFFGVIIAGIRQIFLAKSLTEFKNLFTQKSWLIFPSSLAVYYTFILFLQYVSEFPSQNTPSFAISLEHIQFILLVPLWMGYQHWYANSEFGRIAYARPWAFGTLSIILFLLLQLGGERQFKQKTVPPLAHTLQVANIIQNEKTIDWGEKIAVIDSHHTEDFYADVLGYGLKNYAVIEPVTRWVDAAEGNRYAFHEALKEQNFTKLWIHAPSDGKNEDANSTGLLSKKMVPTSSYLFAVEPDGINIIESYPHPAYDVPYRM